MLTVNYEFKCQLQLLIQILIADRSCECQFHIAFANIDCKS